MKKYVIVLLCLCSLWACKNETQKLAKEMRHVIGQHVIIPDYAEAKVLGESVPIPDSLFKKANIIDAIATGIIFFPIHSRKIEKKTDKLYRF